MRSNNLLSPVWAFVAIVTLLLVGNAHAVNWYVRPSSSGSNTGADWNNAWSISSITWSKIAPGDTIWLAGGTYSSQMVIGASGSSSSPIYIWRVRSTDAVPVAASGWNASFDSQVVCNTTAWPQWYIAGPASYINIDGRIASGILVQEPSSGGDMFRVGDRGNVSNIYVSHMEFAGTSNTSPSNGRYGLNFVPGQYGNYTLSNSTVDHCIIGPINEAFRANNWNGVTIQYTTIHDTTLDSVDHNDMCYFSGNIINTTWRYCTFYNSPSDGFLMESDTPLQNFRYYGNVFYNAVYAIIQTKTPSPAQSLFIYNNVFAGQAPNGNFAYLSLQGSTSGCEIYNNIFYNCENEASGNSGVTSDYNAYYPATVSGVGWPSSEKHSVVLTSVPFNNVAGGDFHLTAAGATNLTGGLVLAADGFLNVDMGGNIRGTGGVWYIGAYQYSTTTSAPTPLPPTNLRITGS